MDINRLLCGNHEIYNEIFCWLKDFIENNDDRISINSCILVSGNSCIGKTYSINKICLLLNLYVIHVNTFNCYNSGQLKDIIFKSATSSLIQDLENVSRPKVIVIDNFDSIFSADKTINQTLLKILIEKKYKNIPIICITNNSILKKIGDLKKTCKIFELSVPSKNDIENTLKYMQIDKKTISILLKNSNGNINRVFEGIDNNSMLSLNNTDEVYDVKQLYNNDFDRNKSINILNFDSWLIPLRFHENLIVELENRRISQSVKNNFYRNYILLFCTFDSFMYKDNIELAIDIFSCIVYSLSVLKCKKNIDHKMDKFTKVLSYLSLQKKYIKQSYNTDFPLYQIGNYHVSFLHRKFIYFN